MRILVVEDDMVLANGLKVGLGLHGATLDVVSSCADGQRLWQSTRLMRSFSTSCCRMDRGWTS